MMTKPTLLFVSPRFLFPADSGGKIRTTQILRGLKSGRFNIRLTSPIPNEETLRRYKSDIDSICDEFIGWPEDTRGAFFHLTRIRHILSSLPIPVATDRSRVGEQKVGLLLDDRPDVVVFDFPHSIVLAPPTINVPSVMFTHNVETWIFRRHAEVADNWMLRAIWRNQLKKMEHFERDTLARFDSIIAVSDADAKWFREQYRFNNVATIPTGVDLEFFKYTEPKKNSRVVFIGSMDWMANIDGIEYLFDEIWPMVKQEVPDAEMVVVGRNPPESLVRKTKNEKWSFTGFVDAVQPYVNESAVCVIPLRVGGGTRIKAYEAMAMGCPVVSTTIGVEGLPVAPDTHYLNADDARSFADAIVRLINDRDQQLRISRAARDLVEKHFSSRTVAQVFESICWRTVENMRR